MECALEKEQSNNFLSFDEVHFLKKELARAYRDEEIFWCQKSREKLMICGDRNSKLFHASVKGNISKRRIKKFLDVNGEEQRSKAAKCEVACAYFQNILTSSNPASFTSGFSDFLPKVTDDE